MKSSLLNVTFLLAVLTIALTACGMGGRIRPDNRPEINTIVDEVILDIWYLTSHETPITRVFAPRFQEDNPHVIITTRGFHGDISLYIEQLPLALAAGTGPDLFLADYLDYQDPDINYLLADWFPTMEADFDFIESDWFMNIFHAIAFEGGLYRFPTHFSFGMVSANAMAPDVVRDLSQTAGVTPTDLLEFARRFGYHLYVHQRFAVAYFYSLRDGDFTISSSYSIISEMQSFIDMDTRTADFNNHDFIDFITSAKELSNPRHSVWSKEQAHIVTSQQEMDHSQQYLFFHYLPTIPQYFLSIDNLLFQGRAPLVNYRGELVITFRQNWGISAATSPQQRQAALDFMRLMQDPELTDLISHMRPHISTYRPLMRVDFARRVPDEAAFTENNWFFSGTREDLIWGGIVELERIADMPAATAARFPQNINGILWEVLEQFQNEYITAWDAAETLQNRITHALREMD